MTAKEMFEELGFELRMERNDHLYYYSDYCIVNIYPLAKTFGVHTNMVIESDLILALYQQSKELGWVK